MKRIVLLVCLLGTLAGCATAPRVTESARGAEGEAPRVETPATRAPERASRETALPGPVRGLVAKAEAASRTGDHAQAAAHLERALNIAPRHPVLWQNLAVVRYREGNYAQAEALALKSNALAAQLPELRRGNWELIAAARGLQGNADGARAAAQEAKRVVER